MPHCKPMCQPQKCRRRAQAGAGHTARIHPFCQLAATEMILECGPPKYAREQLTRGHPDGPNSPAPYLCRGTPQPTCVGVWGTFGHLVLIVGIPLPSPFQHAQQGALSRGDGYARPQEISICCRQSHSVSAKSNSKPVATALGCLTSPGACTKMMSKRLNPERLFLAVASQPTCHCIGPSAQSRTHTSAGLTGQDFKPLQQQHGLIWPEPYLFKSTIGGETYPSATAGTSNRPCCQSAAARRCLPQPRRRRTPTGSPRCPELEAWIRCRVACTAVRQDHLADDWRCCGARDGAAMRRWDG